MKYSDLHAQLKTFPVFSLSDIRQLGGTFHRARLSEWQKKGLIRKIINGYYTFTDMPTNEKSLFHFAGRIYQPSYVSMEMAFSYYHLIPESVYAITSVTTRCTRTFKTPVGSFSFRTVRPDIFWGYRVMQDGTQSFNMADPEKALLDYLYFHPKLQEPSDFEGLRWNTENWKIICNEKRFAGYCSRFQSKSVIKRADAFLAHLV